MRKSAIVFYDGIVEVKGYEDKHGGGYRLRKVSDVARKESVAQSLFLATNAILRDAYGLAPTDAEAQVVQESAS